MSKENFFIWCMAMHCVDLLEGMGKKLWTDRDLCGSLQDLGA